MVKSCIVHLKVMLAPANYCFCIKNSVFLFVYSLPLKSALSPHSDCLISPSCSLQTDWHCRTNCKQMNEITSHWFHIWVPRSRTSRCTGFWPDTCLHADRAARSSLHVMKQHQDQCSVCVSARHTGVNTSSAYLPHRWARCSPQHTHTH